MTDEQRALNKLRILFNAVPNQDEESRLISQKKILLKK